MLGNFTDKSDRETFEKLRFKVILDFRSNWEVNAVPDPVFSGTDYFHICALYEEDGRELEFAPIDIEKLLMNPGTISAHGDWMIEKVYGKMAFDNPGCRKLFQEIEEGHVPILFHCTAGKDRTGVAAKPYRAGCLISGVQFFQQMQERAV